MRYEDNIILKTLSGKRYFKRIKYPFVPFSSEDLFVLANEGDRLDIMANDYYNNQHDYWIICIANELDPSSIFIKEGTQIRIPAFPDQVKADFKKINGFD